MTPMQVARHELPKEDPDWDKVRSALQEDPRIARVFHFDGPYSILHVSCSKNAPISVVQLLVEQDRKALQKTNVHGDLPLHFACAFKQSFEVIALLVRQHPKALTVKNVHGDLPLHVACGSNQSIRVIEWLVQQHPKGLEEKNNVGILPLHCACAHNQSFEVIQWLIHQYPNAVMVKDTHGNLPLHLACAKKPSFEVIELLARQLPNAVTEKNNDGDLPLHFACAADDQSFEVIQLLVGQHPNTVMEKDKRGNTPLDGAKRPRKDRITDPRTVEWLEKVASGKIIPPGTAVDTDLSKLPVATTNDFFYDRNSVLAVLVGKKEMAIVSPSYIESFLTEERIGNGLFGPVYKGTDKVLKRSFAIKAISADKLWDGHSADRQKAKETFLKEIKVLSLFRHPNIESLYAYAFPDDIKNCCYLVCELAEKGSLANFWNSDLGPERLSLFRRRIQIALDAMTAIQFLHNGNDQILSCCYGIIKSASIVLKRDFTAQLIDCGLAKFVVDRKESQSKTKTVFVKAEAGYLCPEYGSGGVSFARSCDIFSFGVVMAELLTGKLQNQKDECGASFNFENQYVKDEKDTTQDIKRDLDPALGVDTWELPKYVNDFADLAVCCMHPKPEDRPTGEAVMVKLWTIFNQCCSRNSHPSSGNHAGDSIFRSLELKSRDKCTFCRTFPPVSPQSVCAVCKSAQERRAQLSFCGKSRRHFAATNAELEASLPLLSRLDVRLDNPAPRLFIIAPLCIKSAMTDPKAWLRSHHRTRYCLYFVCIHSLKAIAPPVPILVTKSWLEKVAPVFAMSLCLLQLGLKPGDCMELGFEETRMALKLSSARIEQLLEAVSEIVTETGSPDVLVRLRRNEELHAEDICLLNGDAYELIVEAAGEERGWRDRMEPVRKDGSPQVFWVSKEVASDTSNGYENVPL